MQVLVGGVVHVVAVLVEGGSAGQLVLGRRGVSAAASAGGVAGTSPHSNHPYVLLAGLSTHSGGGL